MPCISSPNSHACRVALLLHDLSVPHLRTLLVALVRRMKEVQQGISMRVRSHAADIVGVRWYDYWGRVRIHAMLLKQCFLPIHGQSPSKLGEFFVGTQGTPDFDHIWERHANSKIKADCFEHKALDTKEMLPVLFYCLSHGCSLAYG